MSPKCRDSYRPPREVSSSGATQMESISDTWVSIYHLLSSTAHYWILKKRATISFKEGGFIFSLPPKKNREIDIWSPKSFKWFSKTRTRYHFPRSHPGDLVWHCWLHLGQVFINLLSRSLDKGATEIVCSPIHPLSLRHSSNLAVENQPHFHYIRGKNVHLCEVIHCVNESGSSLAALGQFGGLSADP